MTNCDNGNNKENTRKPRQALIWLTPRIPEDDIDLFMMNHVCWEAGTEDTATKVIGFTSDLKLDEKEACGCKFKGWPISTMAVRGLLDCNRAMPVPGIDRVNWLSLIPRNRLFVAAVSPNPIRQLGHFVVSEHPIPLYEWVAKKGQERKDRIKSFLLGLDDGCATACRKEE